MPIQSQNPATEVIEKTFEALTGQEIEARLTAAEAASRRMASARLEERVDWLNAAAGVLDAQKRQLAEILTREMGKTLQSAEAEIEKCALVCRYYAEHGPDLLRDRHIETAADASFVRYRPLGTVVAVMPWNFPFWQVFRFAAPTIMAGNTGLLKHASNVPQSSLAIEAVWTEAGLPQGGFQSLLIGSDQVEDLVKDRRVHGATLTGSEGAGRAVAALAGEHLKPSVMELGGSDAFIVMPSADIDLAIDKAVQGRTQNNGQSCIAAKRFIVHSDIYEDFRARFAARLDALEVGDPMKDETDIGPLALEQIRDELHNQVNSSLQQGARRVCGAEKIDGAGWYYKPGLIENIPDGSPAADEELFGPVASLFEARDLDDAFNIANASRFGLGSALFTTERSEMDAAFNGLKAGATFINTITASDPRLPFGGVGDSGYGRELAREGLYAFMNAKTCAIGETR